MILFYSKILCFYFKNLTQQINYRYPRKRYIFRQAAINFHVSSKTEICEAYIVNLVATSSIVDSILSISAALLCPEHLYCFIFRICTCLHLSDLLPCLLHNKIWQGLLITLFKGSMFHGITSSRALRQVLDTVLVNTQDYKTSLSGVNITHLRTLQQQKLIYNSSKLPIASTNFSDWFIMTGNIL